MIVRKLVLLLAVLLSGCGAITEIHSVENTTQVKEFEIDAKEVYKSALQTAMEFNWNVSMSDADAMVFNATTPGVMSRWEDLVNVMITEKNGVATLTVKSKLGHAPNKRHVVEYLNSVAEKLE